MFETLSMFSPLLTNIFTTASFYFAIQLIRIRCSSLPVMDLSRRENESRCIIRFTCDDVLIRSIVLGSSKNEV